MHQRKTFANGLGPWRWRRVLNVAVRGLAETSIGRARRSRGNVDDVRRVCEKIGPQDYIEVHICKAGARSIGKIRGPRAGEHRSNVWRYRRMSIQVLHWDAEHIHAAHRITGVIAVACPLKIAG